MYLYSLYLCFKSPTYAYMLCIYAFIAFYILAHELSCIYIYMYVYVYMCVCVYIYIYKLHKTQFSACNPLALQEAAVIIYNMHHRVVLHLTSMQSEY